MSSSKKTDVILISAVVVLVALALFPGLEPSEPAPQKVSEAHASTSEQHIEIRNDRQVMRRLDETLDAVARHQDEINRAANVTKEPSSGRTYAPETPEPSGGELLPLRGGAQWTYRVSGSPDLASADSLIIRIVKEPEGRTPGLVETVFGDSHSLNPIVKKQGIQYGGFPFIAPRELADTRPIRLEGITLPKRAQMIDGAVWTEIQHRKLVYRYKDNRGKPHALKADATITNRANARPFETVAVPAGRFGAYRIEWIGRVEIEAGARKILEHLTAEPYRRETMWVSPGVGIVKREINFLEADRTDQRVTLVLEQHSLGQDRRVSDL